MAAMYELEDASMMKNQRLRSLRLIELSDHITRLNRRESSQLEVRLRQLKRQQMIIQRNYDREIYWKRLQLAQIYETLNESPDYTSRSTRVQTPTSFYAIRMRRNQSAPANNKRVERELQSQSRPSTTPMPIRRNKRAMSVFKDITLKPPCRTLGNMLVLADDEKKYVNNDWPRRSRTMVNIRNGN